MNRSRCFGALLVAMLSSACLTEPAYAATPGRTIVVTINGTSLSDWQPAEMPALSSLLGRGAVALLSTRTATGTTSASDAAAEAYRAFGSGRFSARGDASALAAAFGRAGIGLSVIGSSPEAGSIVPDGTTPLPEFADASFPTGRRTDYEAAREVVGSALASHGVVIIDLSDAWKIDFDAAPAERDPAVQVALRHADGFITWLQGQMTPRDQLIVTSLVAPRRAHEARHFLTGIAIAGDGLTRGGTLTSTTTRRSGVVTIADIAPTILRRHGLAVPAAMTGRDLRFKADADAIESIRELESELIHVATVRRPILKAVVLLAAGIVIATCVLVARGARRGGTAPRFAAIGAVAIFSFPALLFLEPLLPALSSTAAVSIIIALASALSAVLTRVFGASRAVAGLSGLTVLVLMMDTAAGGPLAMRSPLSYSIAEGARFHGIGNDAMGIIVTCCLVIGGFWLGANPRRPLGVLALFAIALVVMAAPLLGTKFGAIPTAVPAFALLALFGFGIRITPKVAAVIVAVTVLAGVSLIAVDALRGSGAESHIGGATGDGVGEIIARKARAAGRLLAFSYWAFGLLASVASMAWLRLRHPELSARLHPAHRRAIAACGIAALAAIVANDAGVTAATWIVLLASGFLLCGMLAVRPDPSRSPIEARTRSNA